MIFANLIMDAYLSVPKLSYSLSRPIPHLIMVAPAPCVRCDLHAKKTAFQTRET